MKTNAIFTWFMIEYSLFMAQNKNSITDMNKTLIIVHWKDFIKKATIQGLASPVLVSRNED